MRIVFTIQHPAHVHLFRNAIEVLETQGHDVFVFAREKDIAIELLEIYGIEYTVLAGKADSLPKLALRQGEYELKLLYHARRINPDVMVAMGEPGVAHVSAIMGCPSLIFTDTENAHLQNLLAFPFADRICTPSCYQDTIGPKQVRYPGYHELAYLHPSRFTPDDTVVTDLGLKPEDSFVILRLNAWQAAHDLGDAGFTNVKDVISEIKSTETKVLITSEPSLAPSLRQYEVTVPLDRMHDLMFYADLVIGESATMAAESAVLGTPAVFISTSTRGYIEELDSRYGLVYAFSGPRRQSAGIKKGLSILTSGDNDKWEKRRQQMLDDKIDTTEFILNQIRSIISDSSNVNRYNRSRLRH